MKKNKLNLKALEVKSFVTNMDTTTSKTVKGGTWRTVCGLCDGPAPTREGSFCICL